MRPATSAPTGRGLMLTPATATENAKVQSHLGSRYRRRS